MSYQHSTEIWTADAQITSSGCAIRTGQGHIVAVVKHLPKPDMVGSSCEDHAKIIAAAPAMRSLVDQIARMTTTDEADGQDLDNDQAMNGLIRRARAIANDTGAIVPADLSTALDLAE